MARNNRILRDIEQKCIQAAKGCVVEVDRQVHPAQADIPAMNYTGIKEIASRFRVSTRTIDRWITRGLPVIQVGEKGTVQMTEEDVRNWLKDQKTSKCR